MTGAAPWTAASADRPAVVLVHGLWGNRQVMRPLAQQMARCGLAPEIFQYPSLWRDLSTNAASLQQFIRALPHAQIHLLGHSLGCLVIAAMLQATPDPRLQRAVFLGPPISGCALAMWAHRYALLRPILGRSMIEGIVQAPPRWVGQLPLGVIAGTHPRGIGHFLRLLPGENDGLVQVCETQLVNASAWVALPVHHVGLLYAPSVAAAACQFLQHGRFTGP